MGSTNYNFGDLDILVVDDNEFAHAILRDILLAMRIKDIRHARSGKECLKAIVSKLPDIVIVDLLMKPMSGFELIKRIRAHNVDDIRHLPLLVVSAYSSMDYVTKARDVGASEVLCKPISVNSVYDRLVHMRNSPRQFVRTKAYVGPDRRRALHGFEGMDRRAENTPKTSNDQEQVDGR